MKIVYLSLGSNISPKKENILLAIKYLKSKNINIESISPFYITEPWGKRNQEWMINIVIKASTSLKPKELLNQCKTIEKFVGRKKRKKWMQREIDIDILFYDKYIIKEKNLVIPHPKICERNFVLIPLLEVSPKFVDPVTNKTIIDMVTECKDNSLFIKLKT